MSSPPADRNNAVLAMGLVFLALIFAAVGVFYLTQNTDFMAAETGKHYKHAILAIVLAVASLVAANFVRPKAV